MDTQASGAAQGSTGFQSELCFFPGIKNSGSFGRSERGAGCSIDTGTFRRSRPQTYSAGCACLCGYYTSIQFRTDTAADGRAGYGRCDQGAGTDRLFLGVRRAGRRAGRKNETKTQTLAASAETARILSQNWQGTNPSGKPEPERRKSSELSGFRCR